MIALLIVTVSGLWLSFYLFLEILASKLSRQALEFCKLKSCCSILAPLWDGGGGGVKYLARYGTGLRISLCAQE
jgi:hypothetical protein